MSDDANEVGDSLWRKSIDMVLAFAFEEVYERS